MTNKELAILAYSPEITSSSIVKDPTHELIIDIPGPTLRHPKPATLLVEALTRYKETALDT